MKKLKVIFVMIFVIVLGFSLAGCSNNDKITEIDFDNLPKGDMELTVFKSATCGCCVGWADYAEENGLNTNVIIMEDITSIRNKYNIPSRLRSCHISVIEDYFVEGHVPIEAINKLLEEKPDIDGIVLPGMPSGSAGMPGEKIEEWIVYSVMTCPH